METTRVISTTTIQAPSHNNADSTQKIDLTPWDLHLLRVGSIQKGLLFHNPSNEKHISDHIQHLKHTFSTTLSFFPPLAGRLVILQHEDNTATSHILCNNEGALFVHAKAENTTVAHILKPTYVPHIVHSFFPLNGVRNYQGTSQPLLGVQITELVDGIFIGCTINHVAADGKSFWHFINSWAEISRSGLGKITKLPSLQRWFLDGVDPPIRFSFTNQHTGNIQQPQPTPLPERIFHFTKEKIGQLKSKANAEANTNNISSLQALLTHVWRSVIRAKRLDPQEEIHYFLTVGVRPRLVPPLPEGYFGNALMICGVTMKAGELLVEGGLGKGALEMNKVIALHSDDEKIKSHYESWVRTARPLTPGTIASGNSLVTSSSPRFNFYGNDFGWGKPVAVRSGAANKSNGKITAFGGADEGSVDIEVCLPCEILKAMGNDPEFLDAVSI